MGFKAVSVNAKPVRVHPKRVHPRCTPKIAQPFMAGWLAEAINQSRRDGRGGPWSRCDHGRRRAQRQATGSGAGQRSTPRRKVPAARAKPVAARPAPPVKPAERGRSLINCCRTPLSSRTGLGKVGGRQPTTQVVGYSRKGRQSKAVRGGANSRCRTAARRRLTQKFRRFPQKSAGLPPETCQPPPELLRPHPATLPAIND
jgi:hypothetical protein